ncbi:hypothetical protein J2T17_000129 [Paenibacillus mucilaginosus]
MGLDVLMYDLSNRLISRCVIDVELHKDMFSSDQRWASYSHLRKLHDYYRTNEEFSGKTLNGLISDLNNYKPFLSENTTQLFSCCWRPYQI